MGRSHTRGMFILAILLYHNCLVADASDVRITPRYETAGIIVSSNDAAPSLEIRKTSEPTFKAAHPFTRFDANHLAASLFDLDKDTNYTIRINSTDTYNFKTRAEPSIPAPLRVVEVTSAIELQAALNNALAGDEIRVAAGAYTGMFTITKSGTADNPIVVNGTIDTSELEKPIQNRTGLPTINGNGANHTFFVDGFSAIRKHIVFTNLKITGGKKSGIRFYKANNCTVIDCQFYDNDTGATANSAQLDMIGGGEEAGRHLIQGNHFADLDHPAFNYTHNFIAGVTYYGIYAHDHPGWGTTIRENRFEGHVDGIAATGDEDDTASVSPSAANILAVWPNREMDIYDNTFLNHRDDAIEADGIVVNQRIFRNQIETCQNVISIAPLLPGPIFILRNTAKSYNESCIKMNTAPGRGTIRNIYFYHNTFVRTDNLIGSTNTIMKIYDGTPSENLNFRNNIFQGNHRCVYIQTNRTHNPDFDYSLWWTPYNETNLFKWEGNSNGRFTDYWQAVLGEDPNGAFANPNLSSTLEPGTDSPAIDVGIEIPGINDAHNGAKPDLGAFETGLEEPTPEDEEEEDENEVEENPAEEDVVETTPNSSDPSNNAPSETSHFFDTNGSSGGCYIRSLSL